MAKSVLSERFLGPDTIETENAPRETDTFDDYSDISRWTVHSRPLSTTRENESRLAVLGSGSAVGRTRGAVLR